MHPLHPCAAATVVHEAIGDTDTTFVPKTYIGSTETHSKQLLANHLTGFRHERCENSTELSKHFLKLKRDGKTFSIS